MNPAPYNPLVSVALTTFNGGDLLRQQLDSILIQTYQNYEVVMSDDGSDEYTVGVLNEYCAKDRRFRWSRSTLSRGYIPNTQNAISLCTGEIIVLCDQDDVWFPDKLAEHVKAYSDPSVMWVYNRFVITDSENKEIGYIEDTMPDYFRHKSLLDNMWGSCIGAAQTSYRTHLIKSALPFPLFAPAHDSWIQAVIYPAKPYFINKVLNTYRQHNRNMVGLATSGDMEAIVKNETQAIADNYRRLLQYATAPQIQLWKKAFLIAVYCIKKIRYGIRRILGQTDSRIKQSIS